MSEGLAQLLAGACQEVAERDKAANSKNVCNGKSKCVTTVERSSLELGRRCNKALADKPAPSLSFRANPTLRRPPTDGRPMVTTRWVPRRGALLALETTEQLQLSAASFVLFWRQAARTPNTGRAAERNGKYFCAVLTGGVGAKNNICARFLCGANVKWTAGAHPLVGRPSRDTSCWSWRRFASVRPPSGALFQAKNRCNGRPKNSRMGKHPAPAPSPASILAPLPACVQPSPLRRRRRPGSSCQPWALRLFDRVRTEFRARNCSNLTEDACAC